MLSSLYERNRIWWIRYSDNGKRVRRTLKTRDLAAAKILQAGINRALTLGEHGIKEAVSCSIGEFERVYWPYAGSHKRPRSVRMDQTVWRKFVASAGVARLEDITLTLVERWKAEGLARGLQPTSVNDYLRHLKAMLNWAVNAELLEVNPAAKVKLLKVDHKPPRWLNKHEAARVIRIANQTDTDIHRFFALGLLAGLRRGEIDNARWEWFDFDRLVITVQSDDNFKLKGRRSRTVPLQSTLAAILKPSRGNDSAVNRGNAPSGGDDKKPSRGNEGYLLNGHERVSALKYRYCVEVPFRRVCRKAGLAIEGPDKVTPHTLRHTFASHLVMAGVSLYKVSQWLGHRDLKTTQIYAHLAPQDDEIERLGL